MKTILTMLSLCFCAALLPAQTAGEYIEQGRIYLESQNFLSAYKQFSAALKAAPNNEEANALAAATRLLSLPKQTAAKKFLDQLGFSAEGRDILNFTATLQQTTSGNVIFPTGYDSTRGVHFFRTNILPMIAESGANLAKITHTDFTMSLSSVETGVQAVTIDYGDIQVMRALVAAVQCVGYSLTAQNLSVILPKLASMEKSGTLSIQTLLATYPSLLTFARPSDLDASKKALVKAINLYFSASEFIRLHRPAGYNYLFNLDMSDPGQVQDELTFRTDLTNILASLDGPVVPDASADFTLDLRQWFSGAHTLRSFLPKFRGNEYVLNSLPDYTFGGLVKGLAACDIERALREKINPADPTGIYFLESGYWYYDYFYDQEFYEQSGRLALYVRTNRTAVLLGKDGQVGSIRIEILIDEGGEWHFSKGNLEGGGQIDDDGYVSGWVQRKEYIYDPDYDEYYEEYFSANFWGEKVSPQGDFAAAAGYFTGTTSNPDVPKLYGILAADGSFATCGVDGSGSAAGGGYGMFDNISKEIEIFAEPVWMNGLINMTTFAISGHFYDNEASVDGTWNLSRVGKLTSEQVPVLTTRPLNLMVEAGSNATFTASSKGSPPLSYQWYRNDSKILGATKTSFTVKSASLTASGNVYSVSVRNLAGEAMGQATLSVRDTVAPVLALTNFKSGQEVSNAVVIAKGTASDLSGVTAVWWRLNGGDWQLGASADEWAHWSAELALTPGTNTFQAFAVDYAEPANFSKTNTTKLVYVVLTPLDIVINGKGTISGAKKGQLLPIGRSVTLTATSAAGFGFKTWEATDGIQLKSSTSRVFSFLMQPNMKASATFVDIEKPGISMKSPVAYQKWSNAVFTVKGKAWDNRPGGLVRVSVNSGPWVEAVGWSNWTCAVELKAGTNRVAAFASDMADNHSATIKQSLIYIPCATLETRIAGKGTVSPSYNGKLLPLGKTFTMTAQPKTGSVLSNWVNDAGEVLTNKSTIKFVMQSNLVFQANFVPNPFLNATGSYAGLFYPHHMIAVSNAGYFSAEVSSSGGFSAKLVQGKTTRTLSGKFAVDGTWQTNKIAGATNWQAFLRLDLDGNNQIMGEVWNPSWGAEIWANRSVYKTKNPAPQRGQYTLVLPGSDEPGLPAGDGVAAVNVSTSGVVSVSATLGDRTAFTASSFVSANGYWPLYASLYGNRGVVIGWLNFKSDPGAENDLDGQLAWIKPKGTGSALYPAGFEWPYNLPGKQAFGSKFTSKNPLLTWTNGEAVLSYGNLQQEFRNSFVMTSPTKAKGTNKFSLTLTTSGVTAGLFKGSLLHPETLKSNFVSGAVLQKQDLGYGSFAGTNQAGRIRLQSQ